MLETGTSGLMSGDEKRDDALPSAPALVLDSTTPGGIVAVRSWTVRFVGGQGNPRCFPTWKLILLLYSMSCRLK